MNVRYLIAHGSKVENREHFPTLVRMTMSYHLGGENGGSGVILSDNIILTAAHNLMTTKVGGALQKVASLQMYVGSLVRESNESSTLVNLQKDEKRKKHIVMHPEFMDGKGLEDIAIIKTKDSLFANGGVAAKVATIPLDVDGSLPLHFAASGWGKGYFPDGSKTLSHPKMLQQCPQDISHLNKPESDASSDIFKTSAVFTNDFSSAVEEKLIWVGRVEGGKRQGPCPGDSGGGLFLGSSIDGVASPKDSAPSHTVMGIISHAPGGTVNYRDTNLVVACVNLLGQREFIEKAVEKLGGKKVEFVEIKK